MLDYLPLTTLVLALLLFAGMLLSVSAGRRLAARARRSSSSGQLPAIGAVDGALFALLGLLLAFAFSGSMSRFDARRALIVQEANAIGTAYLRVDLLNAEAQAKLRPLYRDYVRSRLTTYGSNKTISQRFASYAHDQELQTQIWNGSLAGLDGQLPNYAPLVIVALNEMFDITTTRYAAAFQHPPVVVYIMLFAVCFVTAMLVGYGLTGKERPWVHLLSFSGVIAVTIFVIADVEFPNLGLVRIDDTERLFGELLAAMK